MAINESTSGQAAVNDVGKSSKIDTPSWGSYSEYLESSKDSIQCLRQRNLTTSKLNLAVCQQKTAFSDDATPDFNIQFVAQGEVNIGVCDMGFGRSSFSCGPGAFLVVPAFAELNLDGEGDFQLAVVSMPWFQFSFDLELMAGRSIRDLGRLHSGMHYDDLTAALICRMLAIDFDSEIGADSLFSMLMARLLHLAGEQSRQFLRRATISRRVLDRLVEFIHENVEDGINLKQLSQIAGCSKYHFCRSFKVATGLTPNEYLVRLRVEKAKARLKRGEPLVSAALNSGFADQPHMTRVFKRYYGVTPGRFQSEISLGSGSRDCNTVD